MGYRSQVVLAISKHLTPFLTLACSQNAEAEALVFKYSDHFEKNYENEKSWLIRWDGVKWYDSYEDIQTIERFVQEAISDEYEFEVELPKLYITRQEGEKIRSETRGSLVIHRMNFDFGDVGVIDVTMKRKGRDDYTYTVESLEWDNVLASRATIADNYMHTIPVYDRNVNLSVLIKSNHPSPATIHSMNWEGDYSPKYYQRV